MEKKFSKIIEIFPLIKSILFKKLIGFNPFGIDFVIKPYIVIKHQLLQCYVKFTKNKKKCNYSSSEDYV